MLIFWASVIDRCRRLYHNAISVEVIRNGEVARIVKTRIFILLGVAMVLSCRLEAAREDQFIKTIEIIKRATVAVACIDQTSATEFQIASIEGTGFFVSTDGTFLTAGHVAHNLSLPAPPRQKLCQIHAIYFPKEGWKEGAEVGLSWFKIDKCEEDEGLDLAKCKTIENPFTSAGLKIKPLAVSFEPSTQKVGTAVAFTGFPLSLVQPITVRGTIAGYIGVHGESSPREIVIDHNNWPGMSGGPVYLSNGKIIGLVLRRGLNDAVGLAFARSSQFLANFLAKGTSTK